MLAKDEVRAALERFVAAQNAHDIKALESLLLNSPDFLWITRGTPVWGFDAALKRFSALYEGTWRLDAEASSLRITMLGDRAVQIYVPITFTIGVPGQPAESTRFLMNQVLVKNARWLESVEYPADSGACSIVQRGARADRKHSLDTWHIICRCRLWHFFGFEWLG